MPHSNYPYPIFFSIYFHTKLSTSSLLTILSVPGLPHVLRRSMVMSKIALDRFFIVRALANDFSRFHTAIGLCYLVSLFRSEGSALTSVFIS